MHGLILVELKSFAESQLGAEAWAGLLEESGLPGRSYDVRWSYPEEDVPRIVAAAARRTGLPEHAVLEAFGEFVAPRLLSLAGSRLKAEWKTLDVVEHTERAIHSFVRAVHPDATPPYLRVHRTSPSDVIIFYDSPRKLCFVAKGIVKGMARHFGERIGIVEERCMLTGAPDCTFVLSAEDEETA